MYENKFAHKKKEKALLCRRSSDLPTAFFSMHTHTYIAFGLLKRSCSPVWFDARLDWWLVWPFSASTAAWATAKYRAFSTTRMCTRRILLRLSNGVGGLSQKPSLLLTMQLKDKFLRRNQLKTALEIGLGPIIGIFLESSSSSALNFLMQLFLAQLLMDVMALVI